MSQTQARNIKLIRWVMAVAMLALLAPTLSRLAYQVQLGAAPWSVVCTAMSADDASMPANGGSAALDHCPMCLAQATAGLPPVDLAAWGLLPQAGQTVPFLFLRAARPQFVWAAHQPRGPPALA